MSAWSSLAVCQAIVCVCVCTVWVEVLMSNPVQHMGSTMALQWWWLRLMKWNCSKWQESLKAQLSLNTKPSAGWILWKRQQMDWERQKKIAREFGMFLERPEEKAVQGFKKITAKWVSSWPARWVLVCQLIKYTRGCISSVFPSSVPR